MPEVVYRTPDPLRGLAEALLGCADARSAAGLVLEAALDSTGAGLALVGSMESDGDGLACLAGSQGLSGGPWERALAAGDAVLDNGPVRGAPGGMAVENMLAVPCMEGECATGALVLANRPGGFGADQLAMAWLLAGLLAMTARRLETQRALLDAREETTRAIQARGDFLSRMSHVVRTPMNAILGMADLLRSSDLDPTQRGQLETLSSAAGMLLTVINDIMDISRIESGRLALERSVFELEPLLAATVNAFDAQAEAKGLYLDLDVEPGLPRRVEGDPDRYRQVLVTLVGNAVRHASAGGVTVRALARPGGGGDTVEVLVSVRDTGPGLSRRRQESIFEASDGCGDGPNVGLGLSIARELAEMMGGRLEVDSKPGRGSEFLFRAVFGLPPEEIPEAAPEPDGAMDVLLVEDNDENITVAKAFLARLGHRVRVAYNGRQALRMLAEAPSDVVLMDIKMPGMDGLEATRRIRAGEAGEVAASTPVVAMTAHAMRGYRDTCLGAGMTDYLPKPVRMQDLRKMLERVAGGLKPGDPDACTGGGREPARPDEGPGDAHDDAPAASSGFLDLDVVLRDLDGDVALLDDLCAIFRRNAPDHLERLCAALDRGDTEAALLSSHSLKGNAATIGARDLSAGAALVYGLVRDGDQAGAARQATAMEGLLRDVLRALDDRDGQRGDQ